MKIIVASKNPVKIESAKAGFIQMFSNQSCEVSGVSVPSGVSEQPLSDEETLQGATNRAEAAQIAIPEADYWVGMEGGITGRNGEMEAFAWMVILSKNQKGMARTAGFFLPPPVTKLIHEGLELGDADDQVFGASNSKQKNGAVGLLTGDVMVRESLYTPAIVLALIPFKNDELYRGVRY